MDFRPIVAPSIRELFIQQVEGAILSGQLKPGDRLPTERELADTMHISKTVVHEGLRELHRLGFLDIASRRGVTVADYAQTGSLETLMAIMDYHGGLPDEKTARSIVDTADCAIGRDAARLVLDGLEGFRDDYEEHILHHRCLAGLQLPVPCVALCPAGVDVPGYMALIGEGRCADAVRLIRKDNPFPVACAYICEHPCEARCRRNMIDDAINIRGLKRYAVDNAGDVPQPPCAPPTGKKVAIICGGPSGLSCAYYLALMGHKVTIFEECSKLGGMLRYGIPSYRFPREKLEKLKFLQSSPKRDALFWLIFTVPGTPKDLLCYFAGLTDLSWGKWLLLCTVGRLPSVLTSTIGGSALGVKDYQFAILVFAVTLAVSGVGLLIYRAVCRRHERKQQEHE